MSAVDDMYQDIILDHYRRPKRRAPALADAQVTVHHTNPLCGDELDLHLRVADRLIDDVAYDGDGCSISMASASAMTEVVVGRELDDVLDLVEDFRRMMHGDEPKRGEELLDGLAFQGVAKFPVRVKCALLGWMALRDAINTYDRGDVEHSVDHDQSPVETTHD